MQNQLHADGEIWKAHGKDLLRCILQGVEGLLFTFIGHHTAIKRNLRVVIWQMSDGKTKVFFSTDTEMSGEGVLVCSL